MDSDSILVSVLCSLLDANNERIHVYEKAMQQLSEEHDLRILFMNMIDQGRRSRNELLTELQAKDHLKHEDHVPTASVWQKLGEVFRSVNKDTVIKHCCEVEQQLQEAYDEALCHEIPSYLRSLFTTQKEELGSSYEEMLSFARQQ